MNIQQQAKMTKMPDYRTTANAGPDDVTDEFDNGRVDHGPDAIVDEFDNRRGGGYSGGYDSYDSYDSGSDYVGAFFIG